MAKSLYASANGLARKVKKMYLGIEGVARKVKKGYIGINGIARLFFAGGGKPVYAGRTTVQEDLGEYALGAELGTYGAIVSPGGTGQSSGLQTTMYTLDNNLTIASHQTNAHNRGAVAQLSNGAIFACGMGMNYSSNIVEWKDNDLTNTGLEVFPVSTTYLSGGRTPSYGIFVGGTWYGGNQAYRDVAAYDLDTKSRTVLNDYPFQHCDGSSASVGQYLVIYGGRGNHQNSSMAKSVVVYSDDLTAVDMSSSMIDYNGAIEKSGVSAEIGAVFAGGLSWSATNRRVALCDEDLTFTEMESLDGGGYGVRGFALGESALFGGGRSGYNGSRIDDVFEYDSDLVKTFHQAVFENNVYHLNAVTIQGEIGVFAGGNISDNGYSKNLDYYTLE